nr:60S ribosomal protein L7-2 [Tanacetum cinerariifolium]
MGDGDKDEVVRTLQCHQPLCFCCSWCVALVTLVGVRLIDGDDADGHVVAAICNMVAERSLSKPLSLHDNQVVAAMAGFGTASILADPSLLIKGFDSIACFAMAKASVGFRFTSGFEKQTRNSGAQLHLLAAKDRNSKYKTNSTTLKMQLIRIQQRVLEYGPTTQKVFHFLNFLVNAGNELSAIRIRASVSASQYACDTKSLSDMQRDIRTCIATALLWKARVIYRDLRMLLKSFLQQVTTAKELAYTWMSSRNIQSLVEGLLDDNVAQVSKTTSTGQIDGATSGKHKAQTHDIDNTFEAYSVLCARNTSRSRSIGLLQTATATGFLFEETTDSKINLHFLMCGKKHMVVIPKSILKKQKICEEWVVANKVEIEALKKNNVANKNLIFSGAKQYIHEYQAQF